MQKFTFDLAFDEEEKIDLGPHSPEWQEAFFLGKQEGLLEAQHLSVSLIASQLPAILERIQELTDQMPQFESKLRAEFVPLLKQAFASLVPSLTKSTQWDDLCGRLNTVLEEAPPQSSLMLRLNPDVVEEAKKHFSHLVIQEDEKLEATDFQLSWEKGGVEFHLKNLQNKLENLFNQLAMRPDNG